VLIEVEDEGCGVPPDALARIFERFARADSARTRASGGAGLGLAITDAIAKAHGGSCSVASTGMGSIFSLRLPGFTPTGLRAPVRTGVPTP
jgi:two-component system OmpR family sensor kinase